MSAPPSPSGETGAGQARSGFAPGGADLRLLLIGLGGLTVLRLVAGALAHLTEDEAYYRLWSLSLQAGYYDHPPMIAWWIFLGRSLVGDNSLGVRFLPILASALTTLLIVDSVRLTGSSMRTAVRAGIWFNATFLIAFGAILAIPDASASLFWTAAVWCVLKARTTRPLLWWAAAGAAAGLACLSKYSSLFLAPGILLWLALTPEGRRTLIKPWPWVAIPIAAALFGINVWWNAHHDWLSFHKQFGRVAGAGFTGRYLVEFVVAQLILLNPLVLVFLVRALRRLRPADARERLLAFLAISAPFLAYLLVHSLHDRVQAHWPAPLYPALAAAAAIGAEGAGDHPWLRPLRTAAPWAGLAVTIVALAWLALPVPWPFGSGDPAHYVRGWDGFARQVEARRRAAGVDWVGTLSYGEAAQLASEKAILVPVIQIAERDRYAFLPLTADVARPGLVLDLARRVDKPRLQTCFMSVEPLGLMRRTNEKHGLYAAFRVSGIRRAVHGGCWDTGGEPHPAIQPGR